LVALMRPTLKSLEAPKYLGTPEKWLGPYESYLGGAI
jgi:hypothetical protein